MTADRELEVVRLYSKTKVKRAEICSRFSLSWRNLADILRKHRIKNRNKGVGVRAARQPGVKVCIVNTKRKIVGPTDEQLRELNDQARAYALTSEYTEGEHRGRSD